MTTKTAKAIELELKQEFNNAPYVPIGQISWRFFGISELKAKNMASTGQFPCKCIRLGSNKSPWLVSLAALAEVIYQRERDMS